MKADEQIDTWNGRALLTDLYQLTMAYGYWKSWQAEREAVIHLFFRKAPYQSGFTIAVGLATAIDFLKAFHFTGADLDFLATLTGNVGMPLFEVGFLNYLRTLKFACDVDAIPEGTVAFPRDGIINIEEVAPQTSSARNVF
jgi:nicotinate phosphoribosyltransferase